MKILLFFFSLVSFPLVFSQNSVGINTIGPTETLDVNGDLRVRNMPDGNNVLVYNKTLVSDAASSVVSDGGPNTDGLVYFDVLSPLAIFFWNTPNALGYDMIVQNITTIKANQLVDVNLYLPFRISTPYNTFPNGTPLVFAPNSRVVKTLVYVVDSSNVRKLISAKTQYFSAGFKEVGVYGTNLNTQVLLPVVGSYNFIVRIETNCVNGADFRINYNPASIGKNNYFKLTSIN